MTPEIEALAERIGRAWAAVVAGAGAAPGTAPPTE